jgi:CO/xanthine dehydrogenase Mo-binding subunit
MRDPRKDLDWLELEPERYEILEGPAYDFEVSRRDLWKLLGAGVLLVFTELLDAAPEAAPLSTRLHVSAAGTVTLLTGKVEIGQGSRTELTQVVAEEMKVDPARVRVIMGDTALVPDDGGTWASLTTPQTVPIVRRAAAAAAKLLPDLKPGQALPGTVPDDVEAVEPKDWTICGTSMPAVNGRNIVTGAHKYSADLQAGGMLHGKVKRAGAHKAKLEEVSTKESDLGSRVRLIRDGNLVGVIAPTRAEAEKAVDRVEARWSTEPLVEIGDLAEHFRATAKEPVYRKGARYPALVVEGDAAGALEKAEQTHESSYFVRYIAHVPLEPRSALAEFTGDGILIRTGTQVPFGARRELAKAFGVPEDKVRVITSDSGGGFGGKHKGEAQVEAARLAKAASMPVKLEWSREEEFTRAYARPAGVLDVKSGFGAGGRVTAWEFHNYNSGASGIVPPYAFPHVWCGFHRADSPLKQGSYRSLAATANNFAREMHMSEVAASLGIDQVEFRLKNLKHTRTKEALSRGAERFGWGKDASGGGKGFGVASNLEKDGHLALFVELEADERQVKLNRIVVVADFGAAINPDNLRNQITGGVIQGIGGALFEELRYDRQRILNPSLSSYRVPRFSDIPEIEVLLIDRRDVPAAGAGEAPLTMIAPAIGCAIHAATGTWRRELPMYPAS